MQFDRRAEVLIYPRGSLVALSITGLRVTFDVHKEIQQKLSGQGTPNQMKVAIYNMAADTRNRIQELDDTVVLKAGYVDEQNVQEVFRGTLLSCAHVQEGPDVVTRLEVGDGQKLLRERRVSVSYRAGADKSQVLADVLTQLGMPKKFQTPVLKGSKFLKSFAFAGPAAAALDLLTKGANLDWTVQGEAVKVLDRGKPDDSQAVFITPDTGLVGSPERLQQLKDDPTALSKPPGWRITSLLQPRLEPGGKVALRCAQVPHATAFRIEIVQHRGDTHGSDWITVTEAAEPGIPIAGVSQEQAGEAAVPRGIA